jgi:hypothetical protein
MLKHIENFLSRLLCATNQESVPEKVQTAGEPVSKVYKTNFPAIENSRLGGS